MSGEEAGAPGKGHVDPVAARARMEAALDSYAPGFETFFLARFMGMRFAYLPEGGAAAECCRINLDIADVMMNPQGTLHGGLMAVVMDISMGHLVNRVAGPGSTIEMKVQFMKPVMPGEAACEGRFLRRGRSISFMESRFFAPDGALAGLATATWKMPREG